LKKASKLLYAEKKANRHASQEKIRDSSVNISASYLWIPANICCKILFQYCKHLSDLIISTSWVESILR